MESPTTQTDPIERATHGDRVRSLFDRESRRWSGRYAPGGTMRGRVEQFASELARRVPPGGEILDLGCGSGDIARGIAARGYRITGCDVSARMIEEASRLSRGDEVTWVALDPAAPFPLPFDSGRFAGLVASSVLEYQEDPSAALREIARVLRPDGVALLTVPDLRHRVRRIEGWLARCLGSRAVSSLVRRTPWRDYAEYLRLSTARLPLAAWLRLGREAGLELEGPGACTGALVLLAGRRAGGTPRVS
jgi:ubiquinone/menaquinone biosynthesis C-methylase UbiE